MSTFNLRFRPDDYWIPSGPLSAILACVKGENRRQMIRDFVAEDAAEALGEIEAELLDDTVDEDTRTKLGELHPSWMGGEYLPDYLPGEIEIARIVLETVTQDVISIRARRRRRGTILYRIVDEYADQDPVGWSCRPKSSSRPLTLGQLIALIDHAEHEELNPNGESLTDSLRDVQEGCEPEEVADFVTVESVFYPDLSRHYDQKAQQWLERKLHELGDDERQVQEES